MYNYYDMIYAFLVLVLIVLAIMLFLFEKRMAALMEKNKTDENIVEWLKTQQDQLHRSNQDINNVLLQTNQNIQTVLQKSNDSINKRLDNAASYISEVAKEVGQMSEIGRSMKDLQEFLKSPKIRGNIGEEVLKDLISQMFPKNSFHLQYQFKSGERVDAALKTDAGILPIDSKFPMENFRKFIDCSDDKERPKFKKEFVNDVRKHIRAISSKYILPDEGTMDFALMYLPSENVYYEVVNTSELLDYARSNRIYIVSPSLLYAHLQMILLSFEGKKIEAQSRKIFQLLRIIEKDYEKTEENLTILNKHLGNAGSKMNDVFQSFSSLGQKINTANQLPDSSQVPELKPKSYPKPDDSSE